jgi:hypothetical protein
VPALLRSGAAAEALRLVDALLVETPDDQKTLAYRSTALRMLGDARYPTLCDYGRLVRGVPAAATGAARGQSPLSTRLLHESSRRCITTSRRPIAQSMRGGNPDGEATCRRTTR